MARITGAESGEKFRDVFLVSCLAIIFFVTDIDNNIRQILKRLIKIFFCQILLIARNILIINTNLGGKMTKETN